MNHGYDRYLAGYKDGKKETVEKAKKLAYEVLGGSLSLAKAYCERLDGWLKGL